MNLASVLIILYITSNNAAAQTDSQATGCGCCVSGVPGIPGNHGAQGLAGPKGDMGLKGENGIKGDTGLKGDSGIKGAKGDPGIPGKVGPVGQAGIQGEVGLQGATGEKGDKGMKGEPVITPSHKQSAFSVAFYKSPSGLVADQPLKYDTIITNIGSHYNKETGKFVCQYPGTYVFQFTSQKFSSSSFSILTKIIRNGIKVVSGYDTSDGYSSISNMVLLNLAEGDMVWTAPFSSSDNYYGSNDAYCTFSGFLLYPA